MKKKNIVGAIYPITMEVLDYALSKKKSIYVKNSFHDTLPLSISKGSIILFYIGTPYKKVMAKGIIHSIEVLSYKELIKKYKKELMQTPNQLRGYCGLQFIDGTWKKQVYNIKNLKLIKEGVVLPFPITMTGRYISKEEYRSINK